MTHLLHAALAAMAVAVLMGVVAPAPAIGQGAPNTTNGTGIGAVPRTP